MAKDGSVAAARVILRQKGKPDGACIPSRDRLNQAEPLVNW